LEKTFGRRKDLGISGHMAHWYDKNTRENRLKEMESYAREAAAYLHPGSSVLEIAPGPGYLSIALAKMGDYQVTGMDISFDFVEICKHNAKQAGVNVSFVQGNASAVPFEDSCFDFIICSAAFKNFKEPITALREMYRVLKPGGTALIIDMNHDASKQAQDEELEKMGTRGFDRWFVKLSFRTFLRKNAYTKDNFMCMIAQAGFATHEIKEIGMSLYVYLHKQNYKGKR
jgi:ubiquinone/menaquinone biosynthesis C-methylase UbiE